MIQRSEKGRLDPPVGEMDHTWEPEAFWLETDLDTGVHLAGRPGVEPGWGYDPRVRL
jgi:hypothetical protein